MVCAQGDLCKMRYSMTLDWPLAAGLVWGVPPASSSLVRMSKRPPHLSTPASNFGNQVLESAVLALRMQRPEEAERLALGVLKSNRGNVLAAQVLGRALLIQGRPAEAVDPLQRAARRSEDPAIETLLGQALAAVGRFEEGLEQFRRAAARRPPFPAAFLEQAGQLGKIGRIDEAIAVLESGLALTPGAIELRAELGFLHVKRNDRARARELFSQVLAVAPEWHEVLTALAKVMVLDGEYAGAADLYRRALGLRPDDAMARNNLGICLLETDQRDAGEAALRAVARAAPEMTGLAITSLAAASRGRFFLRPSAAAKFLGVETT
jgi:tetratricopeptide (TPR) repeat protein